MITATVTEAKDVKQNKTNKMKIGLIVAMEKELKQIVKLFHDVRSEESGGRTYYLGSLPEGCEAVVVQSGIGKVNSALGAADMIARYRPQAIISTGVAGGADTSLEVCDVVVGTAYCYHDVYCGKECAPGQIPGLPQKFEASTDLLAKASAINCPVTVRKGLIATGDWFVDTKEKMRSILQTFPDAVAVDMESCSIAQACMYEGVPFLSMRIISDIPLRDDKAKMYYDFWERMAEDSFEVTKALLHSIAG